MFDEDVTPTLKIKELTGEKRSIEMVGRFLPYRPLTLDGEQRIEITWLPGSSEGSATILGPIENDTHITGAWKEKFITASGLYGGIKLNNQYMIKLQEICDLFDSIRRQGQLLEFSWLENIRRGFLGQLEIRWQTAKDVDWEMTFRWISQGEQIGPSVFTTVGGLEGIDAAMLELLDMLNDIALPDFGLDFGFLEDLAQIQRTITDLMDSVDDIITSFTDAVYSATEAVRNLEATFHEITNRTDELIAHVESTFDEAEEEIARLHKDVQESGGIVSGVSYTNQTEAQRFQVSIFKKDIKNWARKIKSFSSSRISQIRSLLGGDIVASVLVREGQDLRDIAKKYYGSPFEWRLLASFNDIFGFEVKTDTNIYVPYRPNLLKGSKEDWSF